MIAPDSDGYRSTRSATESAKPETGRLLAAFGQAHEAGPAVARIGDPLHITGTFDLVDEEACGLFRDLRSFGQFGQAGARGVDLGVAAHLAMIPSPPPVGVMIASGLRAGGDYNRLVDLLARRYAEVPVAQLVSGMRDLAGAGLAPLTERLVSA